MFSFAKLSAFKGGSKGLMIPIISFGYYRVNEIFHTPTRAIDRDQDP